MVRELLLIDNPAKKDGTVRRRDFALSLARCARVPRAAASLILERGSLRPPFHPPGRAGWTPEESPLAGAGTVAGVCRVPWGTPVDGISSGLTWAGQPALLLNGQRPKHPPAFRPPATLMASPFVCSG